MTFYGTVDWDTFHKASREAHHLMMTRPKQTIHLLIHPTTERPQTNVFANFSKVVREQPPNTGKVVVVLPQEDSGWMGNFLQNVAMLITSMFPNKSPVKFAKSYDEAMTIIEKLRQTA